MKSNLIPAIAVAFGALTLSLQADITTGLVGYWSLADGSGSSTAADLSGNGNTGTLMNYSDTTYNNMWTTPGDPTNGWPFALNFTNSLAGFGTNTYVNVPDSASIDSVNTTVSGSTVRGWTLSAWVKPSVAGSSMARYAGIVAKGNQGHEDFALYLNDTAGNGKFSTTFRNSPDTGGEVLTGTTAAQAGTWYHVVGVVTQPYNSSIGAEALVYVNGVKESGANNNTYTTFLSNSLPTIIGSRANSSGTINLGFQGTIDEVRIYNRPLSASDITQLYQNKAFALINNGIGSWNGLAGSGGNATLDTTSLSFCTNLYTAPLGTAANLATLLSLEQANALPPGCAFADTYYSSSRQLPVGSTNLTIATGGVALGTASAAGTMTFLNAAATYALSSSDGIGLKDGPNPTSLTQVGTGTLILTGTNTFSGGATISSGTVQLGNGGQVSGQELGTATTVTDNGVLAFNGTNNLSFNSTIVGTGSVTKKGSGTLTLNTANTYSGGTTIINSTVPAASLNDSSSPLGTGPVTLNDATLLYTGAGDSTVRQFNGTPATTNTIDVPASVTLELSGRVTTTAAWVINKTGLGTLTLSGSGDNSFLGLNVNAGTVIFNKTGGHAAGNPLNVASGATVQLSGSGYAAEIYNNSAAPVTISSGGVLDANGQSDAFYSLNLSGTGIGGTGALLNSAASTTATLTVPVTLAANTTVGGVGNLTLAGAVGGNGALTYSGTGILALTGTNTYSGGTYVTSGTLDASIAGAIPGNVTVSGTGILQLDINTAMSSIATLALPSSPVASSVNLAFGGTQTIGVLMIGSTAMPAGTYGAVGSGAANTSATFTGGGILNVTGQDYWDPGHLAASPGSGGSGSWDAGTTDWFTGSGDAVWPTDALAVFAGTAGTVTLNANVAADELAFTTAGYTINNTDGTSVLTLDGTNPTITVPAGNTTIGCTVAESGANPVTVNGPGTLTLSGTNTYAGGTVINGATLSVNTIADANCAIGPAGNVTIQGGGGLSYTGAGAGSTTRNVTANGAATSYVDVPAGSLTLAGQVKSGLGSTGQIYTKTGAGTLVLGGSVDNSGLTMAINQGTVLITKSSATNVHGLGGGTSIVASGATLQLAGSGNSDLYSGCILTVNSGGLFDLGGQNDNMSTLTLSGTGLGGGALINSANATTSFLTNGGSGVVLAGPTTIGGAGNITLISVVSGSGPITYAGTSTLTLNAANTFSGGLTINSGSTVQLNNQSSAGAGTIADNGILAVNIGGGTLSNTITGGSSSVVNIVETSGANSTLGGSMSGFTGTINCPTSPGSTAKAQILNAAVGLPSAATINLAAGGTFYVANAGVIIPCPLNIYGLGNSEVYGALRVENGALISGPVTLYTNTTMGNGQSGAAKLATISGPISQSGGSFGITFTAEPGTIVLSGTNTYTGATTINGGVLTIGGAGQLGGGNYAAAITNNATFNYASSSAQTLSGVISGTNLLMQTGPGVLTLTGTNTYTGATLITNGSTLVIGGGGCLGVTAIATNYASAISNYGTFTYASLADQTLSGVVSGPGTLIQSGPGALTLNAGNTYTGGTLITNGSTLVLGGTGSINTSPAISIAGGATLDVSAYTAYSMLGGITLSASGTATTAATIKGATSMGATVTLAGPMALTFTPQTFNGDATHPALFISQISLGQLVLDSNAITVKNAGASPLGPGTYSLVQVAAGGSISAGSPTVTVTGNGLAAGTAASIAISGGSVNLVVVSTVVPQPAINSVALSGGNLIFSGTNGSLSGNYYVLTSTNVTLPRSQWTSIATNSFSPTGTFSVTNPVGSDPNRFFLLKLQ